MNVELKIVAQGADLTAVASRDVDGFTATITGDIITPMQTDHSPGPMKEIQTPARQQQDQSYGPVEVRAPSLHELQQKIKERIENDGFPYVQGDLDKLLEGL